MVIAATDGSCLGNPSPGGWAWVTDDGREGSAGTRHSTNNRMELTAVLELLRALGSHEDLLIESDSEYVVKIFTERLPKWHEQGRLTALDGSIANVDLIESIEGLLQGRNVSFQWVRGHAGHELNEKADALANGEARRALGEPHYSSAPSARLGSRTVTENKQKAKVREVCQRLQTLGLTINMVADDREPVRIEVREFAANINVYRTGTCNVQGRDQTKLREALGDVVGVVAKGRWTPASER